MIKINLLPEAERERALDKKELIGAKYNDMRMSTKFLDRIGRGGRVGEDSRFACEELFRHLRVAAEAYYDGRLHLVDQFFQLYDLDGNRPDIPNQNSPSNSSNEWMTALDRDYSPL